MFKTNRNNIRILTNYNILKSNQIIIIIEMAGKFISLSYLAIIALLSNQNSPNLVQATFNTVNNGVVRIDLERKYINHLASVQLDDAMDYDLMIDSLEGNE